MRVSDVSDYLVLRRIVENAWQTLRFRKTRAPGELLEVRLRGQPPVFLRGDSADFHLFHRIFVRDEYRLNGLESAGLGCVIDLGGNVGLFTARAAALAERVITYEPFPGNLEPLERNVGTRTNVTWVPEAVAGEPGTLRLYRPAVGARTAIYSKYTDLDDGDYRDDAYDDVPACSLDGIFDVHAVDRCDLLKVDVEGAEYEIFNAASDATFERIARIHCEYHDVDAHDPRTRIGAFTDALSAKGFDVEVAPHGRKPNHGMLFATKARAS